MVRFGYPEEPLGRRSQHTPHYEENANTSFNSETLAVFAEIATGTSAKL